MTIIGLLQSGDLHPGKRFWQFRRALPLACARHVMRQLQDGRLCPGARRGQFYAPRFAEAGRSHQQIKAWAGHMTDSEVARCTAAADQQARSDSAAVMLMANLRKRLANDGDNPLENDA